METMTRDLKQWSSLRLVELVCERSSAEEWGAWLQLPLHHAVAAGDQELTMELIHAGARGMPLLEAVKSGHSELVGQLLLQGQSPRTADENGSQPIHYAATLGHDSIVTLLLQHGAGVNDLDARHLTPLILAAREGHVRVVDVLLDAGADPRARFVVDGLQMPLDVAAERGHVNVIKAISQRDPGIVNDTEFCTGFSPMHFAAKHDKVSSIDALVEAGANLELKDVKGQTALHVAADIPDCEAAVLALLRHGSTKETLNNDNLTPLFVAIKAGNEPTAKALIAAGADGRGGGQSWYSALKLAVQAECVGLMRVLVQHGADVSATSPDGSSCLHWAAWGDCAPAIDFLVEAGANVNAKLKDDETTPLHLASQTAGNLAAIEALARHGANIHAKKVPSGDTPLHTASGNCFFEGSPGTVDALLKAGADETAVNAGGQAPLHVLLDAVADDGDTDETERIHALLVNAPRDRAERSWARRRFFVLCHAFPDRVQLALTDGGPAGHPSSSVSVIDLIAEFTPEARIAPKLPKGELSSHGEDRESPRGGSVSIYRDFSGAMGRLMGLQADQFRTVIEFL